MFLLTTITYTEIMYYNVSLLFPQNYHIVNNIQEILNNVVSYIIILIPYNPHTLLCYAILLVLKIINAIPHLDNNLILSNYPAVSVNSDSNIIDKVLITCTVFKSNFYWFFGPIRPTSHIPIPWYSPTVTSKVHYRISWGHKQSRALQVLHNFIQVVSVVSVHNYSSLSYLDNVGLFVQYYFNATLCFLLPITYFQIIQIYITKILLALKRDESAAKTIFFSLLCALIFTSILVLQHLSYIHSCMCNCICPLTILMTHNYGRLHDPNISCVNTHTCYMWTCNVDLLVFLNFVIELFAIARVFNAFVVIGRKASYLIAYKLLDKQNRNNAFHCDFHSHIIYDRLLSIMCVLYVVKNIVPLIMKDESAGIYISYNFKECLINYFKYYFDNG